MVLLAAAFAGGLLARPVVDRLMTVGVSGAIAYEDGAPDCLDESITLVVKDGRGTIVGAPTTGPVDRGQSPCRLLFSGRLSRSGFYQFFVDDVLRRVISLGDLVNLRENHKTLEIKVPHAPAPASDGMPTYSDKLPYTQDSPSLPEETYSFDF
jgi:hypothetical protein